MVSQLTFKSEVSFEQACSMPVGLGIKATIQVMFVSATIFLLLYSRPTFSN